MLAARITVPDDTRVRIRDCADQRQLDAWLDSAAAATPIADLFG
jgi:hypothetical protein